MAKITVKRTGELVKGLFGVLAQAPEGLKAGEALKRLAESVPLTEYEQGLYSTRVPRFDKVVRFATMRCVKAGWMIKDEGIWSLTDTGRKAMADYPDAEAFYRNAQTPAEQNSHDQEDVEFEAEKSAGVTYDQAKEEARNKIEQYLHAMHPFDFQELVADLLKGMRYHVLWKAHPGPDGGVDIIAASDPLGTKSPRIKVQVKRKADSCTLDMVKAFAANLQDTDVGIFVSAGGFTSPAYQFSRQQSKQRIALVNLEDLVLLWTTFYKDLSDIARRRLPLTAVYFLTPEE